MKQFAFEFSNKTSEIENSVSTFDIKWRHRNIGKTRFGMFQFKYNKHILIY